MLRLIANYGDALCVPLPLFTMVPPAIETEMGSA